MNIKEEKSLFLCTTPFQVKICLEIIKLLELEFYDILYWTRKNDELDNSYFKSISDNANTSYYIFSKKKKQGLNALAFIKYIPKLPKIFVSNNYKDIYIASMSDYLFRYIIKKNPSAEVNGFDDGTANITPTSSYFNPDKRKRTLALNFLMRLSSTSDIKNKLTKHYTVYSEFENIVEKSKIFYLDANMFRNENEYSACNETMTFFIGQPFEEYLKVEEQRKLIEWLSNERIDYYVMHPREQRPILTNVSILDKNGLLAEDAIYKKSKGFNIHIISGYSTVLFNIKSDHIRKTYLSLSNSIEESKRCSLISKTNSQVIKV